MSKKQNKKTKQTFEKTDYEYLIKKLFPLFIIVITILSWIACGLVCKYIQQLQNKNDLYSEVSSFNEPIENEICYKNNSIWHELVDTSTVVTIYNACKEQCNSDPTTPANPRFKIDIPNAGKHKIVAFEKTFADSLNLKFGDIVYIEGTDYDGYYQFQDRMNKRFKGQHKIDLLVDNSIKYGKWNNVKLYKVNGTEEQLNSIRREYFLSSL